jgi:hypothetical protein
VILGGKDECNDNLIEYIIDNQVDLVMFLNLNEIDLKNCLKKTSYLSFAERSLPCKDFSVAGATSAELKRKRVNLKLNVSKMKRLTI